MKNLIPSKEKQFKMKASMAAALDKTKTKTREAMDSETSQKIKGSVAAAADRTKTKTKEAMESETAIKVKASVASAADKTKMKTKEALESETAVKVKTSMAAALEKTKEMTVKAKEEAKKKYEETKVGVEKERALMAQKEKEKEVEYGNETNIPMKKPPGYNSSSKKTQPASHASDNPYEMLCYVCNDKIPADEKTGTVSFEIPHEFFKNEKMCPCHVGKLRRCISCSRYEPQYQPFVKVPLDDDDDNRFVCAACSRTMPKQIKEDILPLYEQVLSFFMDKLQLPIFEGMKDIDEAKVQLVNQKLLKEESLKIGLQQPTDDSMARGLCLIDKECKCKILCISGLPRDLTASVIAHEATHAWIKLHPKNQPNKPIPLEVEEGICQLIAYLFLQDGLEKITKENETKTDTSTEPTDKELRKYFKHAIKTDKDVIYGNGFRYAYAVYDKLGSSDVTKIMNHIIEHQSFPSIE